MVWSSIMQFCMLHGAKHLSHWFQMYNLHSCRSGPVIWASMALFRWYLYRSLSSQYLPVLPSPTPSSTSRDSSQDVTKRSRDVKNREHEGYTKRRSTYNSRDAGYNEEEELRRAIEASREETSGVQDDASIRRPKRVRSDSETWVFCSANIGAAHLPLFQCSRLFANFPGFCQQ